jgi:hypothetical protein
MEPEGPPLCSESPSLIHILIHLDPALSLMSYVLNIALQSVSTFESDIFTPRFPTKICVHFFTLTCMPHSPPISLYVIDPVEY